MEDAADATFFDRADEVIQLANRQCEGIGRGKVSASLLYATARFNTWVSARGFNASVEMEEKKNETIEYFVRQYRAMLEDNLDDYIENFDTYMKPELS